MMDGMNGLGMGLGMVVFWVALIAVIVYAVRAGQNSTTGDRAPRPDARQILEERFARGEISEDELHNRRQALARQTL